MNLVILHSRLTVKGCLIVNLDIITLMAKESKETSRRTFLQGTRKVGCPAHIHLKSYTLYPEFKITGSDKAGISAWKLRILRQKQLQELHKALSSGQELTRVKRYFVSLPSEDAHKGHIMGAMGGLAQRMHPYLIQKVTEMVTQGITDTAEVKRGLKHYVMSQLCSELNINPAKIDRPFYPTTVDVRNHINNAKLALQLSKLDQENLRLLIEMWRKQDSTTNFFFRPYKKQDKTLDSTLLKKASDTHVSATVSSSISRFHGNSADETTEESAPVSADNYEQTLLMVHQQTWQGELLQKYGNTITLMDATYKTTRYDIALFFICVRTNVGYQVVGEFITQSETSEQIAEALTILKSWNHSWSPPYFMVDYSDAELGAIEQVFPLCKVFLCDFHREQAWERWVKVKVCMHILP